MKIVKRFTLVLLSLVMLGITGCGTYHVAMSPTGEIDKDLKQVAKGKVHLFPPTKSGDVVCYKDGLTNLDQVWSEGRCTTPIYVTEADVVSVIAERSRSALRQAGYEVSYGEIAPKDADFNIKEYIESIWICPSHPNLAMAMTISAFTGVASSVSGFPVTELVVDTTFTNAREDRDLVAVGGVGRSYLHLTKQGGYDTSMDKALKQFQENLVKGMVKFQKHSEQTPITAE